MSTRGALVVAGAVVGLVAGCGGGDGDGPGLGKSKEFGQRTVAAASEETNPPDREKPGPVADGIDLRDDLIAIEDLGPGWSVNPPDADDAPAQCIDAVEEVDYDAAAYAEVDLAGRGADGAGGFSESIGYYPDAGAVEVAFDRVVAVVARCGSLRVGDADLPIVRTDLPGGIGRGYASYLIDFTVAGQPGQIRLALVKLRDRLVWITVHGPRVDEDAFFWIATGAVDKAGS